MKPRVLIVRTAGTNCDKETEYAFLVAGAQPQLLHVNYLKEHKDLSGYQIICIPGGFSYGDDLGAGKILSLELLLWLKDHLQACIKRGGLMLGICNGFQVFAKTGILPDLDFKQSVTLTDNDSGRFEDRWVYLKITAKKKIDCVWLRNLPEVIALPVAHGEGKFYTERSVLDTIEARGQVVLRYCDAAGRQAGYPFNPNGSLNNVAGITDSSGRILGLMPHPERFIVKHHWPLWHRHPIEPFGMVFFKNAVNYFK